MPLWGTKDTVYSTGKVNCTTAGVLTKQSGSIAWTSGNGIKVGQVVTLATDGAGAGQGVIKSIDSATQLTLTNLDLPGAFTNVDYEIRETPVAEVKGGSFAVNQVFGVSVAEQQETVVRIIIYCFLLFSNTYTKYFTDSVSSTFYFSNR